LTVLEIFGFKTRTHRQTHVASDVIGLFCPKQCIALDR